MRGEGFLKIKQDLQNSYPCLEASLIYLKRDGNREKVVRTAWLSFLKLIITSWLVVTQYENCLCVCLHVCMCVCMYVCVSARKGEHWKKIHEGEGKWHIRTFPEIHCVPVCTSYNTINL